jgi:phosphatidylglycerol:prolipoprotein diacylglycerol transferase
MEYFALNPGFSLFGRHIAWYGLIMACAISIAVILCFVLARKRGLKSSDFVAPALWALPLAIIGARIMYVLFNPMGITYSFVDALKIWEGGMSIWGGIVGGALGIALYCLIFKKNFLAYGDVIAPGLILAQSIGRWGNFINQEAYGWQVTDPRYFGLPFSVYIEAQGAYHLATFLYEASLNLIGFIVLIILLLKTKKRGLITSLYLMIYGVVRSIIEIYRTDPLMVGAIKMSQLLSIISAVIGLGLFIYIFVRDYKLKQKGIDPYSYMSKNSVVEKVTDSPAKNITNILDKNISDKEQSSDDVDKSKSAKTKTVKTVKPPSQKIKANLQEVKDPSQTDNKKIDKTSNESNSLDKNIKISPNPKKKTNTTTNKNKKK